MIGTWSGSIMDRSGMINSSDLKLIRNDQILFHPTTIYDPLYLGSNQPIRFNHIIPAFRKGMSHKILSGNDYIVNEPHITLIAAFRLLLPFLTWAARSASAPAASVALQRLGRTFSPARAVWRAQALICCEEELPISALGTAHLHFET